MITGRNKWDKEKQDMKPGDRVEISVVDGTKIIGTIVNIGRDNYLLKDTNVYNDYIIVYSEHITDMKEISNDTGKIH